MDKPCIIFFRFLFVGYDMEFFQMPHSNLFSLFVYVRSPHVSTLILVHFLIFSSLYHLVYSSSIQDSTFFPQSPVLH